MTSSLNPKQKLRIDDFTNRAMMLADVAGRVSLMKRDLEELMRALRPLTATRPASCKGNLFQHRHTLSSRGDSDGHHYCLESNHRAVH